MSKYFYLFLSALFLLGGCFNPQVREPLVVIGNDTEPSFDVELGDPEPGLSDDQLTPEQRMQRRLDRCQMELNIKKREVDKIEKKRQGDKKRYTGRIEKLKDKIDELEEQIEDLEKENRKLRKKLYDD